MTGLIGVDWGTSNLRVMRLGADGAVLDRRTDPRGAGGLSAADFADVLGEVAGDWLDQAPVLIAGMAGARQGWIEAPYVYCPAAAADLASGLAAPIAASDVRIVPGVARTPGRLGDVMRGEETQALGVFSADETGLMVAPGTHSKWVRVREGAITDFRTHLTGELFAALRSTALIGRDMGRPGGDDAAFDEGVSTSLASGDLTADLFSVRVRRLADEIGSEGVADYLSGLLIGAELKAERENRNQSIRLVGEAELTARYRRALGLAGFGRVECVSGEAAVARGLYKIWKQTS